MHAPPLTAPVAAIVAALLAAVLLELDRGDADLLSQVARGDRSALRRLYDRCGPLAMALALRILGSRGEAEDVVQEAFVQAWQKAALYDLRRGSATAWVLAIVRSRALDRLRARASSHRAQDALSAEAQAEVVLPIEPAQQRQERELVLAAVAALPEDQRAAIELAYFEGLSQAEIAARTNLPLGTVKTRCRLALQKLAGALRMEQT